MCAAFCALIRVYPSTSSHVRHAESSLRTLIVSVPRTAGVFNPVDWADQVSAIRAASSEGVPANAVMSVNGNQIASGIAARFRASSMHPMC
jgi:hypothetical protein